MDFANNAGFLVFTDQFLDPNSCHLEKLKVGHNFTIFTAIFIALFWKFSVSDDVGKFDGSDGRTKNDVHQSF